MSSGCRIRNTAEDHLKHVTYDPRYGRILYTGTFCPGVNSGIGGILELAAFCLSFRLARFSRAISNPITEFSPLKRTSSSVAADLPTRGIPKIRSIGYVACRSNIKKNGVLCMIVLKYVL